MSGSKDFPDEVASAFARALVEYQAGRSNAEVGRDFLLSGETIRKARGGNVGRLLATRLAKAMGKQLREVVSEFGGPEAVRLFDASESPVPAPPAPTVVRTPRYHNAALALKQLREEGTEIGQDVADDVIEGVALASEEDPPVKTWRAAFMHQLKLRTTYRDATLEQIRKHLGGVEVPEEDVARPRRARK